MISNRKRPTESFIVAAAAQTTIPVTGTLNDSSTGNVNLNNGQIGIVTLEQGSTLAPWAFTDATPTITEAPAIAFVQGTAASASVVSAQATYPLSVRPYEISGRINGVNNKVLVTKQAFRAAKHNIWTIGVPSSSTTGEINVVDEAEYKLMIAFSGRRFDEHMGTQHQAAYTSVSKTVPDFTATSVSAVLARDYIATHIGYAINYNSEAFSRGNRYQGSDPAVAFAVGIALSGPSGAAAGTAISSLTAGTSFAVVTIGGIDRTIVLTQEMIDSLTAAGTASGFTHIFKIDTANAGTATGGTATGLFIMGLDANLAYVDRVPQRKTRLRVALQSGFTYLTVRNVEDVYPDEGQGYARQLELLYQSTQGQRKYSQRHVEDPVVNYPSPILEGGEYVVYNINHGNTEQIDTTNVVYSPFREVICIPRYSSGTTAHAAIALVDTALNSWLASGGNPNIVNVV